MTIGAGILLRLKSLTQVRVFSVAVTLVAMVGNVALQRLFLSFELFQKILFSSTIITVLLAFPIAFYIGLKILDVHKLTLILEDSLNHDTLTGAHTRLSFYERLTDFGNHPRTVIAADIDLFKSINDEHGHKAGDKALKHFAATLINHCKEEDIVARFGGEEFVILLHNTISADGATMAQLLCRKVREEALYLHGQEVRITASFGVAPLSDIADIDAALHNADLAVYRSKYNGRNQVCVYDPDLDVAKPCR
jgi:diguanylate cyclase (GGDEF)-like protein